MCNPESIEDLVELSFLNSSAAVSTRLNILFPVELCVRICRTNLGSRCWDLITQARS